MHNLLKIERFANHILETLVTVLFFAILSLTVVLVIMRYGFNAAIIGGNEAMEYLFIYTTAIGAAVSIGKGDHISITFLVDRLTGRLRRAVNVLNYLLIAFINIVMIRYSIGWIQAAGSFESPVLRIPNWMVQVSVPIGAGLAAVYCLNHVLFEILNGKALAEE